ncbi:MAG: FimB/Mfa2 family fimbrial subunit [Dysgonomonas sp.]|nr:FimB/Mfa2 family fimbrial subunit [Dysgonomonas sp.]
MKKRCNLIWMLIILLTACSNDDEKVFIQDNSSLNNKSEAITFLQDVEGVSVLIFNEDGSKFSYLRSIVSGWSIEGKVSTRLKLGKYKFLFVKSAGTNTSFYPDSFDSNTSFDDVKIVAKTDTSNDGYVLPVDEIWLPETEALANTTYTIVNETTVQNKLTRAVSQIIVHLKRAASSNGVVTELPFPEGKYITDNIKEIKLDINGVGEAVNIRGGIGSTKTQDVLNQVTDTDDDGFATFEGPFLFPQAITDPTTVNITVVPTDDSLFPEMKTVVNGQLERNKKLEITLLVTATYQLIDIIVDVNPMTEISDGDSGIWE